MDKYEAEKQYWELEDALNRVAQREGLPICRLTKTLAALPDTVIAEVVPILQKQVAHLHFIRQAELEPFGNVTVLPALSLRTAHHNVQ